MPNAYTEEVVSAPIETATDLGTPKSLVIREGMRYVRRDASITGVLRQIENDWGGNPKFRDMLSGCDYLHDGRRDGYSDESDYTLVAEICESYEFEVVAGGVYRRRDGRLTDYVTARSSDVYPLIDKMGGITYTKLGKVLFSCEDDLNDLVTAVYLPKLRDGYYGRRRDGRLTGRINAIKDLHSGHHSYLFEDSETRETYTPCGTCYVGCVRDADIVEVIGKWEDAPFITPEPIDGLPLRGGDLVEITEWGERIVEHTEDGRFLISGFEVDPHTGVIRKNDGSWPIFVRRIIRRINHLGMRHNLVCSLIRLQYADRYSWLHLGSHVNCGFIAPWAYHSGGGDFGSLKDTYQRMDGFDGDYVIGLPVSCDLEPESIEWRKHNASTNALIRYWNHRVRMQANVNETTPEGIPIPDCVQRAERLIHKEFPRVRGAHTSNDLIVHVTYETATTAMVLSKENGYFKCKPMTWAKVFTALNKENGIDATDEMRREFIERFDSAVKSSDVFIEWSTVSNTYCTPMSGWDNEDDSVTGSCMEKFCGDDGNGHAVFDVYQRLQRLGKLKMIKIHIEDEYVGRAICWWPDGTSGWVMDRVYCRQQRGEIPKTVIAALSKFASENQIVGRTEKCRVHDLPWYSMRDITADDLTGYDYYPYFDTYAGISPDGVHMDSCDCTVVCDSPDGEPSQDDMHEARGRDGYYREDDLRWSEHYDEYVHRDDAIEDYQGTVIHNDDAVELGFNSDVYAHTDDVIEVRLPNSNGRMETVYAIEA